MRGKLLELELNREERTPSRIRRFVVSGGREADYRALERAEQKRQRRKEKRKKLHAHTL